MGGKPRPTLDYWKSKEGLILIAGWARDGLTNEEIARRMEIDVRTLYRWQKKEVAISNSLKSGKEVVDYAVEGSLLKNALSGNVTAQIYWLKNRRPDKWREQPKEDIDNDDIPRFIDTIE